MASTFEQISNHMILHDVSWESYTKFLDALGDRRLRHSYDEGTLEMMSPLKDHEWVKCLIGRFLEATSLEFDIPIQSIGSTTLRRDRVRKGLEPDACYYIQHEAEVRGRSDYDPNRDPPPDLAIEVDVTHRSVSRMEIYAALGVPEIWRATKDGLIFYRRNRAEDYVKISRSRAFPLLTPGVIDEFLGQRSTQSETALVRKFVDWVRSAKRRKTN